MIIAKPLLLTLLFLFFTSCSTLGTNQDVSQTSCNLPQPTIVKIEGDVLFQYWDLDENFQLYHSTDFYPDPQLSTYRSTLQNKYNVDPIALLNSALKYEAPGDKKNIKLILSNPKKIRKMNCLESKLLTIQNGRVDLLDKPTEFVAFLLRKEANRKLFYFTSNIAGIRSLGYIHSQLDGLLKGGWELEYNLHNHNFFISDKKYRGTVAPSLADSWLYQMELKDYGLKKAIITNGFDSVEIDSSLFKKLSTKN